MTASIKEREDKLCDREDYVEDQVSENKKNNWTSKEAHWKRRNESSPERQVEKDEDSYRIWQGHLLMDKSNINETCNCKNCEDKRRLSLETTSGDKTQGKDWTDATS